MTNIKASEITPTDDDIRDAAAAYRAALEEIDAAYWLEAMVNAFPHGACGHASEMLGRYLRSVFDIEAEYILWDFYEPNGEWLGGHAWLEWNGLVIDITGDQFGWERVIVTRNSARHEAGRPELRQSLTNDANWWCTYCARAHHAALAVLKASSIGPAHGRR